MPIEALARIGTAHPDVLPALIRLLQYEPSDERKVSAADASVFRELAAEALTIVGPEADLAAPLLVRAVRNPRESQAVRRKAIIALGAIGPRAAIAIPALVESIVFDESPALREAAGEALGKTGPAALPVLSQYLQHTDPKVRYCAVLGLRQMSRQGAAAAAPLAALLTDEDDEVRVAVCEALQTIGVDAGSFAPVLIDLLTSELRQVRMRAMRLIVKLAPQMHAHLDLLRSLESDPRGHVRSITRTTVRNLEAEWERSGNVDR